MLSIKKIKLTSGKKKAARQSKAASLSSISVQTIAIIALIVMFCGGAVFYLQGEDKRGEDRQETRMLAGLMAGHVNDMVSFHAKVLDAFVQNHLLGEAMVRQDMQLVQEQERLLTALLPSVKKARFIPVSQIDVDDGISPKLGFATLDLLKQVEQKGKAALVEVHQFSNEHRHIALAVPITNPGSGAVVGVAHLSLAFQLLEKLFSDVGVMHGYIEVQQVVGGVSLSLVGAGGPHSGVADGQLPVPGTIWQVAYWTQVDAGSALLLPALLVLGGLLIIGVVFSMSKKLKGMLTADLKALESLAGLDARLRTGRPPRATLLDLESLFLILAKRKPAAIKIEPEAATLEIEKSKKKRSRKKPKQTEDVVAIEAGKEIKEPEPEVQSMVLSTDLFKQPDGGDGDSEMPRSVFGAYDIRGVVGEGLTRDMVYQLGRAIGSEAYERGQQSVIVGRDGRSSGEELTNALCKGLVDSGRDVVRIGMVPTPVLYFATHFLGSNTGVMVTGSHNAAEYNGLKIVIGGEALSGDSIQSLRQRIEMGDMLQGNGLVQEQVLLPDYLAKVVDDVQLARPLKVVVDSGNGVAGVVAPELLRELGCEVIELFSDVDGSFPNHAADPSRPENLKTLIAMVQEHKADLGLAFDGDGDSLGVVDSNGKIIWPDRLLMLFARDVLSRQPGADVLFDVKSTRHLPAEILSSGGRPLMVKAGHSLIKAKMKETGALLAGEMNGHFYFKERWYGFDDALYACARLLEILSTEIESTAEVFSGLPESVATPEMNMPLDDVEAVALLERFAQEPFDDANLVTVDGVRWEFADGWGLMRKSNTTSSLSFRFEADSIESMQRIQGLFRERLMAVDSGFKPPF